MGAGHGGAGETGGSGVAVDTDGGDVDTGGEDVNDGAEVGEGRTAVIRSVDSTDGDGIGRGGGRGGSSIDLKAVALETWLL